MREIVGVVYTLESNDAYVFDGRCIGRAERMCDAAKNRLGGVYGKCPGGRVPTILTLRRAGL
jgi:hypothetical protein